MSDTITCLVEDATGKFLADGRTDLTGCTRRTLPRNPDHRRERYSGDPGQPFRSATAQEITDDDAAQADTAAGRTLDDARLTKALAIWTANKLSIPLATMRQQVLAIYKGL